MKNFFIYFFLFFPFAILNAQSLGSFDFELNDNTNIKVFYSLPKLINTKTRLVVVMHGRKRNGEEYRNQWAQKANDLNLAIIVPEFSEEKFPGVYGFNYGNVFNESHQPTNNSIYEHIEPLVQTAISKFKIRSSNWGIYGHGAGAHFVHRYVLNHPEASHTLAIAANLGWYLSMTDQEWPFGLTNSNIDDQQLKKAFSRYFLLMLGRADTSTKPNSAYVKENWETITLQGPHRLARGRNFFRSAINKSKELDQFFKWGMVEVPTTKGHSNTEQMVPYAAEMFYARLK